MNKNSLANIIYEKSLQRSYSQKLRPLRVEDKQKQQTNNYKGSLITSPMDFTSPMLKITQFSSGLPLGVRPSAPSNQSPHHPHSLSPYKHFTVKKIKEGKQSFQKQLQYPHGLVELSLKPKQKHCGTASSKSREEVKVLLKRENAKLLITSKWKFKPDVWDMDTLANQINSSQSVVVVKPAQVLPQHSHGSLKKIQKSKDQSQTSFSKERHRQGLEGQLSNIATCRDKEQLLRKVSASPRKRYIEQQKRYQENAEKEKKERLQTRKKVNKNYAKPFNPPENVSAFAYIVYEADLKQKIKLRKYSARKYQAEGLAEIRKLFLHSHKVIVSLNSRTSVEIASLTKIMTCIVVLDLANRYSLRLEEEEVTIGSFEQSIGGTSANIKKGEIYTVKQLLFGLMLPSGNDASLAVAVWGGRVLLSHQPKLSPEVSALKKRDCYNRFIAEMNAKAGELNMQKTKYSNSHGLSNPENRSCCFDLAILCEYAMNNAQFRQIVGCRVFEGLIKIEVQEGDGPNSSKGMGREGRQSKKSIKNKKVVSLGDDLEERDTELQQMKDLQDNIVQQTPLQQDCECSLLSFSTLTRRIRWQNTHQLVQQKPELYIGIKTGITTTAGPCLASCFQSKGRRLIIIVLSCKTMKHRIRDTQLLRRWTCSREGLRQQKTSLQQNYTSSS